MSTNSVMKSGTIPNSIYISTGSVRGDLVFGDFMVSTELAESSLHGKYPYADILYTVKYTVANSQEILDKMLG